MCRLEADCTLNPAFPKGKDKGKGKGGKGKCGCGRGGFGGCPAAYNPQFHSYGKGKGGKGKHGANAFAAAHADDGPYELDQGSAECNY